MHIGKDMCLQPSWGYVLHVLYVYTVNSVVYNVMLKTRTVSQQICFVCHSNN